MAIDERETGDVAGCDTPIDPSMRGRIHEDHSAHGYAPNVPTGAQGVFGRGVEKQATPRSEFREMLMLRQRQLSAQQGRVAFALAMLELNADFERTHAAIREAMRSY